MIAGASPVHPFTLLRGNRMTRAIGYGSIDLYRYWLLRPARLALWVTSVAVLALLASRTGAQEAGIFVVRLDGTQERRVAQLPDYSHHDSPRWSHDGKRLAFGVSQAGARETKMIYVVNVDGTELSKVGEGDLPDWSPDDKQLVSWHHGGTDRFGVWVHNIDGSAREWLAQGW